MEDTTMTDPTRWTVDEDGIPSWRHASRDWNITRQDLAYMLWTAIYPERAAYEAHAALVQCVRDADRLRHLDAYSLAKMFHEAYERLAPEFNYQTRKASAVPWDDVPEHNKALMIATARAVLDLLVDGGRDG
jgi:hypothetical protein